jgi:uncharacterized protein YjbI with pentapeptide repeats
MDPLVVAAWIAAGASVITLIGTLAAQYFGRRATSQDTERALEEQGKQLDRTLAEQREQLDRTLAEQRTRTLNERFATAAEQLGSGKPPAVRLAGVYAMAGLADDWEKNRQTCVDVLCAYLRMPYEPDPGEEAPEAERLAFRASREVRHTVIRVITAHLQDGVAVSWQGLNFDFTGVIFDGGDFTHAHFSGGHVSFMDAVFSGKGVSFLDTIFEAEGTPTGGFKGNASFVRARFAGSMCTFARSKFAGFVLFNGAQFSEGNVFFGAMEFSKGLVSFNGAEFSGAVVKFDGTKFSGAQVGFPGAKFSGGKVGFDHAEFSGGKISFDHAEFSGGTVDFSSPADWSFPPEFPWTGMPPPGVKLPKKEDQSQA